MARGRKTSGNQDDRKRIDRRTGRERRRNANPVDPVTGGIQLLLARLISLFIGALLGFLVANILSREFITPLEDLVSDARTSVNQATNELSGIEPQYNDARQEYQRLSGGIISDVENTSGETSDGEQVITPQPAPAEHEAEPGADNANASDHPAADSNPPAPVNDGETAVTTGLARDATDDSDLIAAAKTRFDRLRAHRQRLRDRIDFWEQEYANYRHDIDVLNFLGIDVVLVFVLLGYLLYPLTYRGLSRLSVQLDNLTAGLEQRTAQATVGFFAGLVIAVVIMLAVFNTFSVDYSFLSYGWFRLLFGAFIVIVLGLSGSLVGINYFAPATEDDPYGEFRRTSPPKLLDTSVIIDGRIHEIAATGFLGGLQIVTNSVLHELQLMADSADERKRSKGRRGLELVRKMQDDPRLDIEVLDDSRFDRQAKGTDEQLILVAKAMSAHVVTNDYNLNRVAAIRDVRVININALANAVKTNHLPGDLIDIEIIDRGKQRGQGVGYLDDGTMVVIEDGEPWISKFKTIKLTSVSQTVQGRLLFGRVDLAEGYHNNGG
ncbi:TRAM domain-containing protein [bacterium]|nr:TRAM domain-containing protein [bacterium]